MRLVHLAVILLTVVACSRKPAPSAHRIVAVPPAENQTGDPSLNWMQSAIPVLVAAQLENVPNLSIQRVERYPDAASLRDPETLFCRYVKAGPDGLDVHCWLDRTGAALNVHGASGSIASWLAPVGKAVDPAAASVPQVSNKALQALAENRFEDAIAEAPDFAPAYVEGAAFAIRKGDAARAKSLIAAAMQRGQRIPALSRARLDLTRATLANDRDAQLKALAEIDKLQPGDETRLRAMVQLLQAAKRNADAAVIQARLTDLHPNNPDDWNQLGYMRAWAGDLGGAVKALERYRALQPDQPNPIDSLGEVQFYFGHFAEAEKLFLECQAKAPQFNGSQAQFKAAMARLNAGDLAGAAKLYNQYVALHPTEKPLLDAEWLYLTGKTEEAERQLIGAAGQAKADIAAHAYTELAFWNCARGDWAAARANLTKALPLKPSSTLQVSMAMVALIASPDADAAEWNARASKAFPGTAIAPVRISALSLGLLFHGKPSDALPVARELEKSQPSGSDRFSRLLLARCLQEAGKADAAAPLLAVHAIPAAPTATVFEAWLTLLERKLRKQS